ncbi:FG-GAP repeat domain-containing protein [Leptolyngbya sp. 7M]|uniref:FG-GAP repeat domain-containing protein n=1 Tax=Leptolyngbya sp. 7M TaxID=2812896 RepID=UPI001B8AA648|nr:VCBS repeat-containing protein [Leptolyngbya sp. 7M]QYO65462.1 VCBS repeat-containing protein [Leptolyngbya sp. 7M]
MRNNAFITDLLLKRRSSSLYRIALIGVQLSLLVITIDAASPVDSLTIFRGSKGLWAQQGRDNDSGFSVVKLGTKNDVPLNGDFDGDGYIDPAIWRSSTASALIWKTSEAVVVEIAFEIASKIFAGKAVSADLDGDGKSDLTLFDPETGNWHVLFAKSGFSQETSLTFCWGQMGDVPVPADHDGDGRADFAVFRPSEQSWHIFESRSQRSLSIVFPAKTGEYLVPADYNGDGRADIAVFGKGYWRILYSTSGKTEAFVFGQASAIPVPADYDGDGETDFAVWNEGTWYFYESSKPGLSAVRFGEPGDVPITLRQVRKIE